MHNREAVKSKALFVTWIALGLALAPSFSEAQVQVLRAFGGGGDMKAQFAQMKKQQKETCQAQMEVRIEDMARACSLNAKQIKRLELAAKGATNRAMEVWEKNTRKAFGLPEEDEEEQEAGKDDKAEKEKKPKRPAIAGVQAQAVQRIVQLGAVRGALGGAFGVRARAESTLPYEQAIWKKNIETVLTDEQQDVLKKHLQKRDTFRQHAAVVNYVSRLDGQLFLSKDQREKLVSIVDKHLGKTLALQAKQQVGNVNQFVVMNWAGGMQQLPEKEMKEVLTEAQFKKWNNNNPRGANGVFQFQPAPVIIRN